MCDVKLVIPNMCSRGIEDRWLTFLESSPMKMMDKCQIGVDSFSWFDPHHSSGGESHAAVAVRIFDGDLDIQRLYAGLVENAELTL